MTKKHFMAPTIIFLFAVSVWSCKSPSSPDNLDTPKSEIKRLVTIFVLSDPWHANIWLDGYDTLKRTNDILYGVELGTHEIWLLKPGFEDWKTSFTLTEQHIALTYTVNANLVPVVISVTNPTSDTIWVKGKEALITWTPSYVPPNKVNAEDDADSLILMGDGVITQDQMKTAHLPTVKIYLFKRDAVVMTIASEMENTGSYSWTVDPSLEIGSDYKVRVNATPETERISLVFGDSPPFTIK